MSPHEDAQMARGGQSFGNAENTASTSAEIAERWRYLRSVLIRQLDMFETGGLTLRANDQDVSKAAIADLKRDILEFDALISGRT